MPAKKAAKGSREGPGSGTVRSDEEILKERRRMENFATADSVMGALGWGAWALAGIWFLVFSEAAASGRDLAQATGILGTTFRSISDANLLLLVCGVYVAAIGRSSPKGSWSWWRKTFHLLLGALLVLAGVAFLRVSLAPDPFPGQQGPRIAKGPARWVGILCALGGAGVVYTRPGGPGTPAKGASTPVGKAMLVAFAVVAVKFGLDSLAATQWKDYCGPISAVLSALPLFLLAGSFVCAYTEAELVASVTAALLLCLGALARALVVLQEPLGALLPAAGSLAFAALFLPLPLKEPDINPFYVALCKNVRRSLKLLTNPVEGFGDSSED